jgi:ribonuclease D
MAKLPAKRKKKKLTKKMLKQNLARADAVLASVQSLVSQGKTAEDPEMQRAVKDLQSLVEDVSLTSGLIEEMLCAFESQVGRLPV